MHVSKLGRAIYIWRFHLISIVVRSKLCSTRDVTSTVTALAVVVVVAKLNDLHCIFGFGFCFYFCSLLIFFFLFHFFYVGIVCASVKCNQCTAIRFYHNVKSIEMRLFDESDAGTMVLLILSVSSA